MQAIGSIGAIAAAIWLATQEARRQRRERIDLAVVCASSIRIKLTRVSLALDKVSAFISNDMTEGFGPDYTQCARLLRDAGEISNEEILPIVCLPDRVAARLASARDHIAHCISTLDGANESSKIFDSLSQHNFHINMALHLDAANTHIESVLTKFSEILK